MNGHDKVDIEIRMTRAQAREFAQGLTDDEFRARLEQSPREVLAEYGIDLPSQLIPENVSLPQGSEVEQVLYRWPEIAEAAVFGVPDPRWIEKVVAAVVLRPDSLATADDVIRVFDTQIHQRHLQHPAHRCPAIRLVQVIVEGLHGARKIQRRRYLSGGRRKFRCPTPWRRRATALAPRSVKSGAPFCSCRAQ